MSKEKHTPGDLLPLPPAVFHILLSLAEGERHGYALKREIAARTDGRMRLGPGVLYGSIAKMQAQGLIDESDDRPDPHLDDRAGCARSARAFASSSPIESGPSSSARRRRVGQGARSGCASRRS